MMTASQRLVACGLAIAAGACGVLPDKAALFVMLPAMAAALVILVRSR